MKVLQVINTIILVLILAVIISIRVAIPDHLNDRIIYVHSQPKPQYFVDFIADKVEIDGCAVKINGRK